MLAALQYGSAAIPHTECLGKRRNLNTSRTGETVSDRARPGRRPVSSNPVPLHDAGPRRAGGRGNVRLNERVGALPARRRRDTASTLATGESRPVSAKLGEHLLRTRPLAGAELV